MANRVFTHRLQRLSIHIVSELIVSLLSNGKLQATSSLPVMLMYFHDLILEIGFTNSANVLLSQLSVELMEWEVENLKPYEKSRKFSRQQNTENPA